MSVKSRLQECKTWFTLAQAAKRLGDEFNEDITKEDVLELALEGDLAISMEVCGNQKAMPLQKGEQIGVRSAPYLSPITGYKPGKPGLPDGVIGHVNDGIYRVGIDASSTKQHLHRLIGGDPLGTVGTPAWYLIMDDADGGDPHLFVPLQPIKETKLLPFPSLQSLLVRRDELEAFITKVSNQNSESAIEVNELKALEVLGLLAEALSKQHPGLYSTAGKPNRSGIVSVMRRVVENYEKPVDSDTDPISLYGFGKSTLDETLKVAIEAWKSKKDSQF